MSRDLRLALAIAVLAVVGLGIASYLTYVHYAGLPPLCLSSGGCEKVQSSHWSKLAGVPVATIGLAGYVAILAALLIPGEAGPATVALLALVGFGLSTCLTYLELFGIHAIRQWCVASALLMTTLAALATVRLLRAEAPARR